jgi:hypothetical protein
MAWKSDTIELEVLIEFDYVPFVPARTMGPPEDCYPAEGGFVEVNAVYVVNSDGTKTAIDVSPKVLFALEERLYQEHASEGDY